MPCNCHQITDQQMAALIRGQITISDVMPDVPDAAFDVEPVLSAISAFIDNDFISGELTAFIDHTIKRDVWGSEPGFCEGINEFREDALVWDSRKRCAFWDVPAGHGAFVVTGWMKVGHFIQPHDAEWLDRDVMFVQTPEWLQFVRVVLSVDEAVAINAALNSERIVAVGSMLNGRMVIPTSDSLFDPSFRTMTDEEIAVVTAAAPDAVAALAAANAAATLAHDLFEAEFNRLGSRDWFAKIVLEGAQEDSPE